MPLADIADFVAARRAEGVAIDVKLLMLLGRDLLADSPSVDAKRGVSRSAHVVRRCGPLRRNGEDESLPEIVGVGLQLQRPLGRRDDVNASPAFSA